jgi:hypothetical protein
VIEATKMFPLPSADSTFCVRQPSRLARLDSLDVYVLPADKFPGNVRRSITPQEFLLVSTLFAMRGWRAKQKIHYYFSQSATGDCKFHKLRLRLFSHCAKLISILGAGNIAAFSALAFDLQVQR